MRRIGVVTAGLVIAMVIGTGGYLLGAASERPSAAAFTDLDQALAVALGATSAEVRDDPRYEQLEVAGCVSGTCRQVRISPVPGPGTAMQSRLYDAGWVLLSHDEPECVSDNPWVSGFVCSYTKDDVTVSVQAESPETPDSLQVWASTG